MVHWCARQRSDARHVIRPTDESDSEVASLPHHCLSAGLLVLMQDWEFHHRCLVLDGPKWGPIDNLHGTPRLDHAHSSFSWHLIKSMLVLLAKLLFHSCSLNFFQVKSARSSLVVLFPSLVKGLIALLYNTSMGVTLASRGNSASKKSRA